MRIFRFSTILFLFCFLGCSPRIANLDAKGETIVCFGDSITQGIGARPGQDYPSLLQAKVSLPVINAGVAGNTTAEALDRIDEDVFAHDPKMVIIILGGNDFLQKVPREETFANLDKIVTGVLEHGAMAVVGVVKTGLFGDGYTDEFKRITKKHRVLFIPNIMKDILTDPKLKADRIHPNAAGYRLIAERVYKAIEPVL